MGIGKKHDITDIYGVKSKKASILTRRGEEEAPESGIRHSTHYHRYFRGYTEIRKVNPKGRVVVERFYTRPWIVSGLSPRRYWLVRLLYALLTAASAVLYLGAMSRDVPGNFSWVVALPGLPTMVALFLLAVVALLYIFVPRRMTLWDHASSTKRLKVLSLVTGIGQALTALAQAAFALATGLVVGRGLACAGAVLLAACCSGSLFFLERKMPYGEIPNETKLPTGETHEIW